MCSLADENIEITALEKDGAQEVEIVAVHMVK